MQDVGDEELLMLLLVIEADLENAVDRGPRLRVGLLDQRLDRRIDMRPIRRDLGRAGPRDQPAHRPRVTRAGGDIVGVEQEREALVEDPVARDIRLHEEGLENVFARHDRLAEATRRAVKAWGLDIICREPKYYSPTITAVLLPDGHDADAFRALALDHFNISYGSSFGRFTGKMFRIGHLGDINDAMLLGGLAATEMALSLANVPHKKGGVQAAMDYLVSQHGTAAKQAAE